ncbi:hypothetical protein D3C72_1250860 [compost metagenome]
MIYLTHILMDSCSNRVSTITLQSIYHLQYGGLIKIGIKINLLHLKNTFGHRSSFIHHHMLNTS